MTFDAHANFAYSTVATAPSPASTGTSLLVASGQGALFPVPPFNATVWPAASELAPLPVSTNAEIVRVTAISGDTLTITRAQEGSSERSIGVGDQIAATITAKTLTDVESKTSHATVATVAAAYTVAAADQVLMLDATGSLPPTSPAVTGSTSGGSFANGTYYWEITATGGPSGESLPSSQVTATVAGFLAAPSGLAAAAPTGTTGTFAATGTYYYKITATNAAGETVGSAEVSAAITATTQTVPLSWTAESGATGYKIYRSTTSGGESTSPALLTTITSGSTTSYTDTGTATTTGAVPSTNTAATATGSAALSWTAAPGATGYRIYRSTTSGGEGTSPALVASVGSVTTYTDTGTATTTGAVPSTNNGSFTVTLPASSGSGRLVTFKAINSGSNVITVDAAGSDQVDGAASTTVGPSGSTATWQALKLIDASTGHWRSL